MKFRRLYTNGSGVIEINLGIQYVTTSVEYDDGEFFKVKTLTIGLTLWEVTFNITRQL